MPEGARGAAAASETSSVDCLLEHECDLTFPNHPRARDGEDVSRCQRERELRSSAAEAEHHTLTPSPTQACLPSLHAHPRPFSCRQAGSVSKLASPALHRLYRLELIASLDLALHILFVLSFILSPSHFLTLVIRIASEVQFSHPRKVHPSRSLRFFLTAWVGVNLGCTAVHVIDGSVGTKGSGWAGKGLVIDFIGQSVTPSRLHLFLLNMFIAALQFVLIVVAYAEAARSEGSRAGYTLLGLERELAGDSDQEHDDGETSSPHSERVSSRAAYLAVGTDDEEEEDDELGRPGGRKSTSSAIISGSREDPLITIRLRAVWNEVAHPADPTDPTDPTAALEEAEEGRAPPTAPRATATA